MSASTEAERNNQDRIVDEASLSMQPLVQDTKSESITATLPADGSKSESETTLAATTDDSMASPSHTLSSPIVPGAFASSSSSSSSTIPSSSSSLATASDLSKAQDASDKPLPAIADSDAAITSPDTAVASSLQQQQQQLLHIPGPSMPKSELESSMITTVSPVRRSIYKRKMSSQPKGILKPAPPPQKGFSFRRDILQSINTRLAQQGVNVQVPMPQSGTAQATASYIGGMFRKIGGIAAGAAANVSGSNSTTVGGLLSNDPSFNSNGSSLYSQGSLDDTNANKSGSNIMSSSGSTAIASQQNDSENGSTTSLVKNTVLSSTTSAAPLKKVQFQVSHMSVTYPIVGAGTPEDEDLTRLRIEREHRRMLKARRGKPWTPEQLEALYRECCRTREEHPLKKMRLVFQEAAQSIPPALKTMDLSFVPLDRHAVEPIADLLSVDFGLNKLVLENCALTDDTVKSILHALLVSGTLPNLSIASNRKIRFRGWKYVAIFMRRARALRYLDLSENSIDRLSLEHLLAVIIKPPSAVTYHRTQPSRAAKKTADAKPEADGKETSKDAESAEHQVKDGGEDDDDDEDDEFFDDSGEPLMPTAPLLRDVSDDPDPPTSAVTSLRLENCGLKAASLEMLSQAVRFSDIRHLSLRRNKIGQLASVALAIMLKDYPDSVIASDTQTSSASARDAKSYFDPASAPFSTASGMADAEVFQRNGRTLRPSDGLTTSERFARSYSPGLPEVPVIVSSPGGGITSRKMPGSHQVNGGSEQRPTTFYGVHTEQLQDAMQTSIAGPTAEIDLNLTPQQRLEIRSNSAPNLSEEEAVAIYQAKRARRILADLPRVGNLLTLDLKSNDIRGGVVYLAQVLKKNRTLRVLNLSDNNIEMPGLVAVAEALKYNSTLETLDMSHNPCSGPGLEGITTLRTAFALNSNLKRLFLNDTDLSSEAAIALAEFLPEARSLIHLDLAENFDIDIAGVMALAVSLRMNQSLRCLDLNIPPNNPDFARLSQEILQSCVRNTELAQQRAAKKGLKQRIAAPIYRSVVARAARENDERLKAIETARATAMSAAAAKDRAAVQDLLTAAGECRSVLRDLLSGEEKRQLEAPEQKLTPPGEFVEDLTVQSAKLRKRLGELAGTVEEEDLLESILTVHDELSEVSTRLERFYQYGIAAIGKPGDGVRIEGEMTSVHLTTPDQGVVESGLTSPAFSIADSDEEDSEVESGSGKPRSRIAVGASGASANGEASNMPQHSRSHQASLSDMMDGLGIQTHSVDRDSADREEREPEHEHEHEHELGADGSPLPPRAPTETLAKGQLSEEAELFRKTKCLQYDFHARHSQDDERLARLGTTPDLACTPTAPPSPHTDPLQAAVHNAHLSGEQLRKDLLRAHVPPKSLTSTP